MAAKDVDHKQVRRALEKDGWTVTDDPLALSWGKTGVKIDLGLERLLAAEKDTRKIAVEIKSFLSRSRIDDLEHALGQLVLYRHVLRRQQPERELFLAVRENVYLQFFALAHVEELLKEEAIRLIVFNTQTEEILKWIP